MENKNIETSDLRRDTVYYAGTATLHFGVRCRDVAAIAAFVSFGSESRDEEAIQALFHKEFSKQNAHLKLNEVKVVKLTADRYEKLSKE